MDGVRSVTVLWVTILHAHSNALTVEFSDFDIHSDWVLKTSRLLRPPWGFNICSWWPFYVSVLLCNVFLSNNYSWIGRLSFPNWLRFHFSIWYRIGSGKIPTIRLFAKEGNSWLMKVFITGASGFLGQHVVARCQSDDALTPVLGGRAHVKTFGLQSIA